ncbi:Vacuolar ATPase assembly integral membrane protein VMA21 [Hondaea fermentalgiana]|uniref:Vacuolar ATPase assembly integral membrane protein VMA21 n=1 Tax=Hondaea fermentalgiana TaxID=2315210 RepID=A0A2R5GDJ0_9STRA|nr:Vacuolar ATPase assembly integral membrane protein VMA21 [Hondaea fermentalgiana]|eukprot:GBG25874.1 Vacuolar ATPase assembly integral membrane protein VMA21 [Hondaea fermentalgiana]
MVSQTRARGAAAQAREETKGSEARRASKEEEEDREDELDGGAASVAKEESVRTNLFTAMGSPDNAYTVYKLLFFMVLMAAAPLGAFFYMRDNYLPSIGVTEKVDIISGVSAIFTAQIVIALYVVMAFSEDTDDVTKPAASADATSESKKEK